ncbi:DUF898 family protein [Ignavigranum ruoffiae]|uniref:DUF898 family protein n=1 Tax=Ignavigranum ruoffiae TaxID=89093 RepID=UPI0024AD3A18|nr:DUF898 family protein [Ignavigranum ruoffiae]
MKQSYFDGSLLSFIGNRLLALIIICFTLGLATPWAVIIMTKWEIEHTVVNGQRLYFDGTATQLFGHWLKWWFLTIITFGIYSFWVGIHMRQWKAQHTYFR